MDPKAKRIGKCFKCYKYRADGTGSCSTLHRCECLRKPGRLLMGIHSDICESMLDCDVCVEKPKKPPKMHRKGVCTEKKKFVHRKTGLCHEQLDKDTGCGANLLDCGTDCGAGPYEVIRPMPKILDCTKVISTTKIDATSSPSLQGPRTKSYMELNKFYKGRKCKCGSHVYIRVSQRPNPFGIGVHSHCSAFSKGAISIQPEVTSITDYCQTERNQMSCNKCSMTEPNGVCKCSQSPIKKIKNKKIDCRIMKQLQCSKSISCCGRPTNSSIRKLNNCGSL